MSSQSANDPHHWNKIMSQLFRDDQLAYLVVDDRWRVKDVSDNFSRFGFSALSPGDKVTDYLDFITGLSVDQPIELPIVLSPSSHPVKVSLIPEAGSATIVIMDAQLAHDQQQLAQQQANENQLLLARQHELTTELQAAQAELTRKNQELLEATRLQSRFLSGVSHEFRTPLTSILGYTDLLLAAEQGGTTANPEADYLTSIRRSGDHLLSLIENLLDHGKYDSDTLNINIQPTNLNDLVADVNAVMQPQAAAKELQFNLDRSPQRLPTVAIDGSRLRQCLINLVGNAVEFTREGGVEVKLDWQDQQLHAQIIDSGIGISANDLKKVTQPFWQAADTGETGTGLGLTITKRIIEFLGGEMAINSEPDRGTAVAFSIPAPVAELDAQAQPGAQDQSLHNARFLLAEDDEDIAQIVMLLLEEQGICVERVADGMAAVEAAADKHYDFALMDLNMPVMNGFQAMTRLREQGFSAPIVAMTASAEEHDRQEALDAGCDGYLVKPVEVTEIIEMFSLLREQEEEN